MSAVQKKRKNTKEKKEHAEAFAAPKNEIASSDSEDDKNGKRRAVDTGGWWTNRLCIVFVTMVCFAFYDAAKVHKTIYNEVFHVSSKDVVEEASRASLKKHKSPKADIIVEDTKNTELLLIRSGAINQIRLDYETERLQRALKGQNDIARPDDDDENGKERDAVLFKDKQEALEASNIISQRIAKRAGKSIPIDLGSGDFDLSPTSLRAGKPIHEGMELEDILDKAMLNHLVDDLIEEESGDGDSGDSLGESEEGGDEASNRGSHPNGREVQKIEPPSRKLAFAKREPDPEFLSFVNDLRADNTFAHLGKKNDMERALKLLGYKQSTKNSRKVPMWIGFEDKGKCPMFKKDETRISFCPLYIPQNKADQFSHIQAYADKLPTSKLKADFYPLTWRLYKETERRSLKLHCTNESISEFGEAYVRKFTVPGSNYMKSAESIYDQLVKSDKKMKELTKETKNRAIVQHYINNPLLIDERKFIIRTFGVIVSVKPFIVLYHDGAVFRSVVKYKPFTRHDSDYKKAAHITSEQKSAQKKVLKSSELYTSFNSLQQHLIGAGHHEKYVNNVLRPSMKARMIYTLYAILNRQRSNEESGDGESTQDRAYETLPNNAAVLQTTCFDFLLDDKKKLWLITVATGPHCFINMGGSSFRPAWKASLQESLSDQTANLAEEILWRRMNKKPISSMRFFTQTGMTVLIDETFPDWDVSNEINSHVEGIQVEQDNRDYTSTAAENDEIEVAAPAGSHAVDDDDDGGDGDEPEEEED